jgi:hypothetical protein
VHAEGVKVGETARPTLFQRRSSLFTAGADDVVNIEVLDTCVCVCVCVCVCAYSPLSDA